LERCGCDLSEFLYVGGYYAPAHPEFTHVIIADRAVPSCPSGSVSPGHRCAVYPFSSVTDAQWALLEPLLPPDAALRCGLAGVEPPVTVLAPAERPLVTKD